MWLTQTPWLRLPARFYTPKPGKKDRKFLKAKSLLRWPGGFQPGHGKDWWCPWESRLHPECCSSLTWTWKSWPGAEKLKVTHWALWWRWKLGQSRQSGPAGHRTWSPRPPWSWQTSCLTSTTPSLELCKEKNICPLQHFFFKAFTEQFNHLFWNIWRVQAPAYFPVTSRAA